jgi:hypothetical protein
MSSKKIFVLAILAFFMLSSFAYAEARIQASAAPASAQLVAGETVEIAVNIDMSQMPEKLGSFTATLTWNTDALVYETYEGGKTAGFESPVINETKVSEGTLTFANANPIGAEGMVNILNVKFKVMGQTGLDAGLNLEFTAMAAAESFNDLLPEVKVSTSDSEIGSSSLVPTEYKLGNYPNPFNPSTEVQYQIANAGLVEINIYNVLGQKVRSLVNQELKAGAYTARWDGTDDRGNTVAAGTYVIRMQSGSYNGNHKIQLVK